MLWASPRKVSQQALSQRLISLPSDLFLQILLSILPLMQKRWAERKRPLPPEITWAQEHYSEVELVDGSTLDALIRKLGLLKDLPQNPLAGRMTCLLNLCPDFHPKFGTNLTQKPTINASGRRFWKF